VTPLAQLLEAALFSAARPVTVEELQTLDPEASLADVRAALEQLREHYDFDGHAVEVVELAGGYQILTRRAFAAAIEQAQLSVRIPKLTGAALETLAVISYRQPVGRAEVEDIRGVSAGGVLRTLQERGLIEVVGRSDAMGERAAARPRTDDDHIVMLILGHNAPLGYSSRRPPSCARHGRRTTRHG